jgi:tripartite ATP-independent transporter DctM subunit
VHVAQEEETMSTDPGFKPDLLPLEPKAEKGFAFRVIDFFVEVVLVIAFVGEIAAIVSDVIARTFFYTSFLWADEIAKLALSILTFVGGAYAYRRREHVFVRAFINTLSPRAYNACLVSSDVFVVLIASVAAFSSLPYLEIGWAQITPVLNMPLAWMVMPLTGSMLLIVAYAGEHLWRTNRKTALLVTPLLFVLVVAAAATRSSWLSWFAGDTAIVVSVILFLVSILLGLPVGFGLLLSTASYLWLANTAPMVALPQNMVSGTSNFVLLALPFFVLAGLIMERGGISFRLVHFVHALVGHLRSGLLQVMVVSMYLVSGLSGSKSADVAAVGTVMRGMLKREHYSASEGTAVLSASAAMGECIPPSIAMLVLGSITKLSMVALFLAGLVPAAVVALCLMILIYIRAFIAKTSRSSRASFSVVLHAGLHSILPLLMPVFLFVGILTGIATPTEVSALAVIYGLVLAVFVYREMNLRQMLSTIVDSAALAGMVLFILAAAQGFSWALTDAYVPQRLVQLLNEVNNSVTVFMLVSIVLLIVAGSLLEGFPALNVLAPLLLPIALQIGVSELHYGIVLLIAVGIGAFIPPAGVGFYICCAIMHTRIEEASIAMIPYLICLVIGLIIVAFVPWFTLVLPHAFGLTG